MTARSEFLPHARHASHTAGFERLSLPGGCLITGCSMLGLTTDRNTSLVMLSRKVSAEALVCAPAIKRRREICCRKAWRKLRAGPPKLKPRPPHLLQPQTLNPLSSTDKLLQTSWNPLQASRARACQNFVHPFCCAQMCSRRAHAECSLG